MTPRQLELIREHGNKIIDIFGLDTQPVLICKQLRRIEVAAHRWAEQICNGEIDLSEDEQEAVIRNILDKVDRLLHFRAKNIPVFVNLDPRGYALKIECGYATDDTYQSFPKDWGGYGIIAPEITGAKK